MKFKNKKTNEIVEVKGYVQEFAYSHNSEWEKVLEDIKKTGQKPKKEGTIESEAIKCLIK